jgi:threonine dehydrogenase-like Zn-dependent dehydrogenase
VLLRLFGKVASPISILPRGGGVKAEHGWSNGVRALQLISAGDVRLVDAVVPTPRAGQALVKVRRAGICATDRELVSGALQDSPARLVPGHEIGGVIAATNGGHALGTRVVVVSEITCNGCDRGDGLGWPVPHLGELGFDHDGGWADVVVANDEQCLAVPESIPDELVPMIEPLLCPAGALDSVAGAVAGARVAVIGSGVAAANFVQAALWLGATSVTAFISRADRAPLFEAIAGRHRGAVDVIGSAADRQPEVDAASFDVVVDSVGTERAVETTIHLARRGATLVWYGLRDEQVRISTRQIVLKNLNVVGRTNPDRAMWPRVIAAVVEGTLHLLPPDRVLRPGDVPAYLGGKAGDVKAVIDFS